MGRALHACTGDALNYVDDCAWIISFKSYSRLRQDAHQILLSANQSFATYGLHLEPAKTEVAFFDRSHNPAEHEWWKKDSHGSIISAEVGRGYTRWLGFLLDRNLSWKYHIADRINKAHHIQKKLRGLMKKWGLRQELAKRAVEACTMSKALYGAEIWWDGTKRKLSLLDKLSLKCGRDVAGLLAKTQKAAVYLESTIQMPKARLDLRQKTYAIKAITGANRQFFIQSANLLKTPHSMENSRSLIGRLMQHLTTPGSITVKLSHIESTHLPSAGSIMWSTRTSISNSRTRTTELWTDGSAKESSIGYAFSTTGKVTASRMAGLGSTSTILDVELQAVAAGLKFLVEHQGHPGPRLRVNCDSQADIARLRHTLPGPGQNLALLVRKSVNQLRGNGTTVSIRGIKADSGLYPHYDATDLQAKMARSLVPETSKQVSANWLFEQAVALHTLQNRPDRPNREYIFRQVSRSTPATPQQRQTTFSTTARVPGSLPGSHGPENPPNRPLALQRRLQVAAAQLRTGSALTPVYLHRIKKRTSNLCECGYPGTITHIFC